MAVALYDQSYTNSLGACQVILTNQNHYSEVNRRDGGIIELAAMAKALLGFREPIILIRMLVAHPRIGQRIRAMLLKIQ